jgi:hypothetical protein
MWQRLFTIILCVVWAGPGMTQSPARQHSWLTCWTNGTKTCPSVGCCPDDYCGKPCPVIADVSRCGGPNDYCRKPMPCLADIFRCGGCDDYCRKPLPSLLCPPCSPFLQCGPTSCLK